MILKKFNKPLPLLREIVLNVQQGREEQLEEPSLVGATNLVSLTLDDAGWRSVSISHLVFPNLTHLKLKSCSNNPPSVTELVKLFRNSPLIEDLQIDAAKILDPVKEDSAFLDQLQPVDLPHLQNMRVTTSRSQHTLLVHINPPPTCSVSMEVRGRSFLLQPPLNALPTTWKAFTLPSFSSVTLRLKRERHTTDCAVIINGFSGGSISISNSLDYTPFADIEAIANEIIAGPAPRDRDDDYVFSAGISLVRKLPLDLIQEFVLEDLKDDISILKSFEIPPDLIKLICSDLPNLTTLSCTRTCVSELFKILTPPPPPPPSYIADLFEEGRTSESVPCQTLKVLEMHNPEWIPQRHCPEAMELVRARKYENVPLQRVLLHSPVMPETMAIGISRYVDEVDIRRCTK